MPLRSRLLELAGLIADQAEKDPEFASRLKALLGAPESPAPAARSGARRAPALFDPVEALALNGREALSERLRPLTLEQLRDMIADFGMSPGKSLASVRKPEALAARILEVAAARAAKGEAFRGV